MPFHTFYALRWATKYNSCLDYTDPTDMHQTDITDPCTCLSWLKSCSFGMNCNCESCTLPPPPPPPLFHLFHLLKIWTYLPVSLLIDLFFQMWAVASLTLFKASNLFWSNTIRVWPLKTSGEIILDVSGIFRHMKSPHKTLVATLIYRANIGCQLEVHFGELFLTTVIEVPITMSFS